MSYVIQAVLSNAQHPEYGQVTIPFPIPNQNYDCTIELLEPLEIGDTLRQDCQVDELDSFYMKHRSTKSTPMPFFWAEMRRKSSLTPSASSILSHPHHKSQFRAQIYLCTGGPLRNLDSPEHAE